MTHIPNNKDVSIRGRYQNDITFKDGIIEVFLDRENEKSIKIILDKENNKAFISSENIELYNENLGKLEKSILGETLVEFLKYFVEMFITHTHPNSNTPPIPNFITNLKIQSSQLSENVLSKTLKIT